MRGTARPRNGPAPGRCGRISAARTRVFAELSLPSCLLTVGSFSQRAASSRGKGDREMRSRDWMSISLFCSVVVTACGRADEPSAVSEEGASVIGGESDPGDPSVVAVYAQQPGADSGFLCTGSVIAPTVVLTAAHCVSPSETGRGATFTVLTSANINRGDTAARRARRPPQPVLE